MNTCTFGSINPLTLKIELNTISTIAVKSLNQFLKKYEVPIPQDIFGIFKLSDIFLNYADGYIFAGATPTFEAPAP